MDYHEFQKLNPELWELKAEYRYRIYRNEKKMNRLNALRRAQKVEDDTEDIKTAKLIKAATPKGKNNYARNDDRLHNLSNPQIF